MIAQFTLGATSGYGEVGQDKFGELRFRELNRNGRGSELFGRHGHGRMALFEDIQDHSWERLSSNIIKH